ncbi:MAG: GNAT family N-acetyltransferase [Anaerolineales bacterium]|nr:GNAT family N-acetyltransferase [Anaerolineales bacterium]
MISQALSLSSIQQHIRRLDARHDLVAVADLVELCFDQTLDPDGRSYLQSMREAARNAQLLGWTSSFYDYAPTPLSGYVWEEEQQIIGNLSLIPIKVQGQRCYLIANVAVHPEQRGRGIARALTTTAMNYARSRQVQAVWLQVRDDNPPAIHIYRSEGFGERARRTTWYSNNEATSPPPAGDIAICPRRLHHWPQQRLWLHQLYPAELSWHLPLNWSAIRPDLLGILYRLFTIESVHHWAAERAGEMLGVITRRRCAGYTDELWLAAPGQVEPLATRLLLAQARRMRPLSRPLTLNLPADFARQVLLEAGFSPQQTLIWMESRL